MTNTDTPLKNSNNNNTNYTSMTVIVVDPCDSIRATIVNILQAMGFEQLMQATNGKQALEIINSQKVDLILSEWKTNKMDGIELLEKIRSNINHVKIPFVMMSSTIQQSDVVRAIKSGVSEYVVKPFSAKILMGRVKRAIDGTNRPRKTAKQQSPSTETKTPQPLNILVVDDVVDNIQVISDILRVNYRVKAATSGEKALKICLAEPQPDLILLDVMMPKIDGFEVCRRLKENPHTQHIAIIFLTALEQTEHIVRGFELGAVDYITKPINPPVVKARVNTHCHLINSIKQMRDQIDTLQENLKLKKEFERLTNIDFKLPMERVMHSVEEINASPNDTSKVLASTSTISQNCLSLSQSVDNAITLGKIENGAYPLQPQPVNIKLVIKNVVEVSRLASNNNSLNIDNEITQDAYVMAEELLTLSLLSNVFNNAIEGASYGTTLVIKLSKPGSFYVVAISHSCDVPKEDQASLLTTKNGGDMYAAKLMAEAQNGAMALESKDGLHTTVNVSLPVAAR